MKQISMLLLVLIVAISSFGQAKNGRISGSVIDGSRKVIESATISLLRVKDSATVKFSVADRDGKFVFENIRVGQYVVSVSAVGHQKGYSEMFEVNTTNLDIKLKTIELIPQAKEMSTVTVTGRKPFIEQKVDKMVVNVDASVP